MSLSTGSRLGPYEIVASLGAGGMGEVWRAKDTRLNREVAIKILPVAFSGNAQLLARFEREARSISALNHPNICTLYDVGRQDDVHFLVMELLDGETLAKRLERGPLPPDQVLRYGAQIAEALHHAHRQGIVHRDLKPANIVLTKNGAKLLDFGLARTAAEAEPVIQGLTSLPTEHQPLTQEGTILGTFQYMAPEQLEGQPADARTDIFGLGAVLFEMATARKAFVGKSKTSLIAAIVSSQPPPISTIQPVAPPALEHVVRKCLEKDPDDRWQSAHDLAGELRWIGEAGSQAAVEAPALAQGKARRRLLRGATAAFLAVALTAAAGFVGYRMKSAPSERVLRSALLPPPGKTFNFVQTNSGALTVSPDGKYVTFSLRSSDGEELLWLRPLDSLSVRSIPGTKGGTWPFWSPDSRQIAFFAEGKLKKVDLAGSPAITLCDATEGRSGGWNAEGVILFSPNSTSGIHRVPAAGGNPEPVTELDEAANETTHRWASFLPDGRHFMFMAGTHNAGIRSESNAVYLGELGTKRKDLLLRVRSNVLYSSGHLLYTRDRVLLAQPFDLGSLRLAGDPQPLAEEVGYDADFFRASFGVSQDGVLAYSPAGASAEAQLTWVDRTGKALAEVGQPGQFSEIALAPDSGRVAYSLVDPDSGTTDLWVEDLLRGTRTRLTFGPTSERNPVWSPDGERIAYNTSGRFDHVYVKPASGGGEELLYQSESDKFPTDWSRDGKLLVLQINDSKTKTRWDLAVLPLTGKREPVLYLSTEFNEQIGRLSPDGRWMAYLSNESGRDEIYVAPYPAAGGKWQISQGGALGFSWRQDGKEILFVNPGPAVMSVSLEVRGAGLEVGTPRLLFEAPNSMNGTAPRDAQRLLLALRPEAVQDYPIYLAIGWPSALRR